MARQVIDTSPPTGDPAPTAFGKVNANFVELYDKNDSQDAAINGKQPNLGFTPVRQGGGSGMGLNTVLLGWGTASRLKVQVDSTPQGDMYTTSWFDPLSTNAVGWLLASSRDGLSEGATKVISGRPGTWKCTGVWLDGGANAMFVRIA